MADTHIEFQDFIKELDLRNGQEAKLQSSRDALIGRITSHFGSKGLKSPRFESQGSYALATQNRPIDDDFDLDQGVYLQHYEDSASVSVHDAMTLIEDATNGHTSQPNPPKPTCVRVLYKAASDGTPAHHVDLAVYREKANGEKLYANRDNGWMASDQKGFIEHFKNNKSDQMHRLVRLLKGWADFNGGDDDSKMPSGFHLTVCVLECFVESKDRDDKALVETAEQILKRIQGAYIQKSGSPIIRPVIPNEDIFESFSFGRITNFEAKLKTLLVEGNQALISEKAKALSIWNTVFGDRFVAPQSGGDSKSRELYTRPFTIGRHGEAGK